MDTTSSDAPRRGQGRRTAILTGAAVWVTIVAAGFASLFRHSSTPGAAQSPPNEWPMTTGIPLHERLPTLLLFAHPRCPCTRATIAELARLMTSCNGKLAAHVVFYSDPTLGSGWERTDLWEHAERIPGVLLHADPFGATAELFCAHTSGLTLLYGPDGRLRYFGGITGSRGHEGDNEGAATVLALVDGPPPKTCCAPVYGCELRGPTQEVLR